MGRGVLVAASLMVALLLGEMGLRALEPKSRGTFLRPPNLAMTFQPSPEIMPGVSGPARFRVNADGLRGDERSPDDTFRILALGGSTTECTYLDHGEAWPGRLQDLLNTAHPEHRVWVGNAGLSGRRTRSHLLQLEALLEQIPDVDVVLMLVGANDATKRLAEDADYDPEAWRRPEARPALLARAFQQRPEPRGLFDLALLDRVHRLLARTPGLRPAAAQDPRGESYLHWRAFRARSPEIRDWLPDLESGLAEYAENIDALAAIATRHGARIVFLTQPSLYRPDLPPELEALLWMGGVGNFNREPGHTYYSAAAMHDAFLIYNATLLERCRERRYECIDLEPLIPKDTRAFYDDLHFNEAGAERVARILSESLGSGLPFAR